MNRRRIGVGGIVLALGLALWLLAWNEDRHEPEQYLRDQADGVRYPTAALEGRGPAPKPTIEPSESAIPTEDELLAAWDPKKGVLPGNDTLTGIVVDEAGTPIETARVWLRSKPGQPSVVDAAWVWNTSVDEQGRFELKGAWARRSILGAWAPGYDVRFLDDLALVSDLTVALVRSPTALVVIQPPPQRPQQPNRVSGLHVRVRLAGQHGSEHPRPGEPLTAEWEVPAELNKPIAIHIPDGATAYLAARSRAWVSDPGFAEHPSASKEISFRLVESARISLRLFDAETNAPLEVDERTSGQLGLVQRLSGFWPNTFQTSGSTPGKRWFDRGLAMGEYDIRARRPPYKFKVPPAPIRITRPGQEVSVEIPMVRDKSQAIVRVHKSYAPTNQRAGSRTRQSGPLFVRRHGVDPGVWTRIWEMSYLSGKSEVDVLTRIEPGTYDVLAWEGGSFPSVAYRKDFVVEGGQEHDLRLALQEGFGFRPSDVVRPTSGSSVKLRAECTDLGRLPWIDINGGIHMQDDEGFTETNASGYIGLYPCRDITFVERLPNGKTRRFSVKPSISPPGR